MTLVFSSEATARQALQTLGGGVRGAFLVKPPAWLQPRPNQPQAAANKPMGGLPPPPGRAEGLPPPPGPRTEGLPPPPNRSAANALVDESDPLPLGGLPPPRQGLPPPPGRTVADGLPPPQQPPPQPEPEPPSGPAKGTWAAMAAQPVARPEPTPPPPPPQPVVDEGPLPAGLPAPAPKPPPGLPPGIGSASPGKQPEGGAAASTQEGFEPPKVGKAGSGVKVVDWGSLRGGEASSEPPKPPPKSLTPEREGETKEGGTSGGVRSARRAAILRPRVSVTARPLRVPRRARRPRPREKKPDPNDKLLSGGSTDAELVAKLQALGYPIIAAARGEGGVRR